jgi:hypothetical protein
MAGRSLAMPFFVIPLIVWSALWTGLALWHAARRDEKGWFIFFLLVHTMGIVELIYLIVVVKAFAAKATSVAKKRKRS